ncbi:Putative aminoglycoside phosphotransferase [bacterium HR29]|mgnify:CR=1 FL=1|jgi:aminoglycoside phosphotransferase (APT) family kinase protein|nr:Putative aminoglycoside phosphotransferase [bacterium HR29]
MSAGSQSAGALRPKLEAYLSARLEAPGLRLVTLWRVPGGASRETWIADAELPGQPGRRRSFVIRRDPPASLLDSDRELEFAFYRAFAGSNVPVPRALWLERDPAHLGSPFFVMERIEGCEASPRRVLDPSFEPARPRLARRMYEILAAIHAFDWRGTPIEGVVEPPAPEECWRRELEHWERVIDEQELSPQPVVRAAIRWLRANPPPPPARVTVVHGDYRVGNLLFSPDGEIHGVLDWEMAHLGDPLEDLAWSFLENWEWGRNGLKGGVVAAEEAIAVYEAAAGTRVDRSALHWWDVFSSVKAQAIWLTGARSFQEGRSTELIHAMTAYWLTNFQDEVLLRSLGRAP